MMEELVGIIRKIVGERCYSDEDKIHNIALQIRIHRDGLTREYFAKHNWEIVEHEPDKDGFILWEAKWSRRIEEGSPYSSKLTVTNMMWKDRFCVSGHTGAGSVNLMAYTEEDLFNILRAVGIYDYYKKECYKEDSK